MTVGLILLTGGNIFPAMGDSPFRFDPLFRLTKVTGDVFVCKPDGTVVKGQEYYAYPYGSKVMTPSVSEKPELGYEKPSAIIKLSAYHNFRIPNDTEIVIGASSDSETFKTIEINKGTLSSIFRLPFEDSEKAAVINALKIKTRIGECIGIDGKSEIKVSASKDGFYSVMFAFTDTTTKIYGNQFELAGTQPNAVVELFGDESFTRVSCLRGSVSSSVQRGVDNKETTVLKTGGLVKIWRVFDNLGELEAVSVIIAASHGKAISYSYIEGRSATSEISISGIGGGFNSSEDETSGATDWSDNSNGGGDEVKEQTESSGWDDLFNSNNVMFDF